MITSLPRPITFDGPPAPPAAAASVYAPQADAPDRRPQPIEAIEPDTRVRRDQPGQTVRRVGLEVEAGSKDASNDVSEIAAAAPDAVMARRGPFGWLGLNSTPFMAQLAGQNATPRDPVAAGRSQTSFRHSPVDRYEEVQGWGRRAELMFVFDGLVTAAAA